MGTKKMMAKADVKAPEVVADSEALSEAITMSGELSAFAAGVRAWFQRAQVLQVSAAETLAHAKAFRDPINLEEDERMRGFAKACKVEIERNKSHFAAISRALHRGHKWAVGQAALAVSPLEQAKQIADAGHQRYEETERKGSSRTTWSAEVYDQDAFIVAVVERAHGIPLVTLEPNQKALNEYARSLKGNLGRWPGVRAVKKVTTI